MYSETTLSNQFRRVARIERRPYMPRAEFSVVRIYPTGWMKRDEVIWRGNDEAMAEIIANDELMRVS